MKLEVVNCYNCGSPEYADYDAENGFNLRKCTECSLVYVSPRPSLKEINQAAKLGEHQGETVVDVSGTFNGSAMSRYREVLQDFFPQGFPKPVNWLDIGCGHGEFITSVRQFSDRQVDIKGCEPNQHKIASAKLRGLNVDFFDLCQHQQRYDYISALNVFSHLPNPIENLSEWKSLLKPGGSFLLETGHSSHLDAKDHHKPYQLPDHLSFANQQIVEGILERIGFQVVQTRIYRHTSLFPELTVPRVGKELAKFILGKNHRLFRFFPAEPNRDMFILATLK
jgi:SAM-dependent methyltransferase